MLSSFSYVSNSPCTKTTKRPKRSQAASHFATNLVHLATDGHEIFIQNFLFCKGKSGIPGFFISYSVIMYQSIPKPPIPPGHLTRVKLRTVGNLTLNEARPAGHLIFVSKRLSAVGNKTISQFFDSALTPHSRVIALVDSTWVFLLLSFLYRGICHCLKCGAKTSWTRNS